MRKLWDFKEEYMEKCVETLCMPTHMRAHTQTQMYASLSSSNSRKAPPEACLTNRALILVRQGQDFHLWPPSPGAILAPCAALSLYCTPGSHGPARPRPNTVWTHNQREGAVKRGTHNVWTQSPAHDKPAKLSHTPATLRTHTHAHQHQHLSTSEVSHTSKCGGADWVE